MQSNNDSKSNLTDIQTYGNVLINIPIEYTMVSYGLGCVIISFILWIVFANYHEQCSIKGYLNSNKGVVNIFATQPGVMTKSFIQQGMQVKKGDKLFYVENNQNYNIKQIDPTLEQLTANLAITQKSIVLNEKILHKMQLLLAKNYVSKQEITQQQEKLNTLYQQKHQQIINIAQQRALHKQIIQAPIDGVISNVMYHRGQFINQTQPLASILPKNSQLIAELYIPVINSRFLQNNNLITLKYDAYPQHTTNISHARLYAIGTSILTDVHDDNPIQIGTPYYKAYAQLESQNILLHHQTHALQQGMTLTATLSGPKQKIWQWIFGL